MSERITTIATALRECARVWVPETRLVGNISAGDLFDLADAVLAAEERQKGADEELDASEHYIRHDLLLHHVADALRAARRPPAPTLREQAIEALRGRLNNTNVVQLHANRDAMELALQALEEAGDE